MTKLMDQAIDHLRAVPPDPQDDIARAVIELTGQPLGVYRLTPEERADLDNADAEIERGEFATEEEVQAIWAKSRP